MRFGYFLSCEEYDPAQLLEQARLAEQAGFEALWISDHFHPWNDNQGQSPFVWSMIGALSQVCDLPITTAVTCPTVRIHPANIAQAAATSAVLTEGKFILGLGTGEALNEHITGEVWPSLDVRLEMLEEAVHVIRRLWNEDGFVNHQGKHYTLDTARIYTKPDQPPPIYISGFGPKATESAGRIADGYITTSPDTELLDLFRRTAGADKPTQAGVKVCYADDPGKAAEIAHSLWANSGVPGELAQVLPSPRHFEQASQLVTTDMTRDSVACGPDPAEHIEKLQPYVDAGFDELYIANMGPHYTECIRMLGEEVLPQLRSRASA
jgi:G6PDH family F420-dependent oxidoreductase